MNVAIRYFTGTGNTARACALMVEEFENAGWGTDVREIKASMRDPYGGIAGCDLLIVAFPVLVFSPPTVVRSWFAGIPKAKKNDEKETELKAAVLCLGGGVVAKDRYVPGWGGGAPFAVARRLSRRGFAVVGVGEASYPENWTQVSNPPREEQAELIRERNDPEVRAFARELADQRLCGQKKETAGRVLARFISLLFSFFGRPMLSRIFVASSDCVGCGLCARTCPAGAIRMKGGRPRWNINCAACNRCINLCPAKAIRTSNLALSLHSLFYIASLALALSLPINQSIPMMARGVLRIGIILVAFLFQIGPFSFLLAWLSRRNGLKKIFEASFMKNYRRYSAPDFTPERTDKRQ